MKKSDWKISTGLSINKITGEELSFFIWKDDKKMKFSVEEARELFPTALSRHESSIMFRLLGSK